MSPDTAPEPPSKGERLLLADSGRDRWAAIEAAQFGCVIEKVEPHTKEEETKVESFAQFFRECAEQWEGKSPEEHAWALELLGSLVLALREMHYFVYWTVIQKNVRVALGKSAEMPIAILGIVRDNKASITVEMPDEVEVG